MAATIKVIEIVRRAEKTLNDDGAVYWKRIELQDWINDAYREIVTLKPEANAVPATVSLAAGVRQNLAHAGSINLPAAIRILDVVRNMATTSLKRAVALIDRKVMDEMIPDWSAATASVDIGHWMFDPATPKEFLVYPPAPTSPAAQVEIVYSIIPTQHALSEANLDPTGADTTVISLDDIYSNTILDYVLYRAFLKDFEAGVSQKAITHQAAFANSLGAK